MAVREKRIYLASRSPRRRELLKQIGINFEVLVPDVNESPLEREQALDYVQRIARIKAEVTWMRVVERHLPKFPVLAADTTVALGKHIIGKPGSRREACEILRRLSGNRHRVLSAVAMTYEGRIEVLLSSTLVHFRKLTDLEIQHYVETGEPQDKAGGYAIQGRAAAFVSRIEGSYSGVMGLPLFETAELLEKFGMEVL
jgi:septum formation protein